MARYIDPQPQYLTDLALPMSGGFLYFYETETSTFQNTYSDPELATPNPNPIPLDASGRPSVNIFLDGIYKVILRDSVGNLIWEKDPVTDGSGASREAFSDWRTSLLYNFGNIVIGSDGNAYWSLQNGNINHNPTTSPSWWERIEFIRYWNPNVTYSVGEITQDTNGNLWKSSQNANLNNTPSVSSTWWDPAFDLSWGDVITASGSIKKNINYQVLATSAAVDIPIPTLSANDFVVVHNCMQSTQVVRLTNATYTIRGKRGTATTSDNIVLAIGDTAILVARTSTDLEAL